MDSLLCTVSLSSLIRYDIPAEMNRPFIIGVGGTCSNSGKTTIASLLLQHFTKRPARPQATENREAGVENAPASGTSRSCNDPERWGAIKYTKTELYTSLVDDTAVLTQKDKDTGRFYDSGAEAVLWVNAPPQDLKDILPLAVDRLSYLDGLIVEGNSAIEFLKPDIVLFIFGNDTVHWKAGIERLVGISDIIVYEHESGLPEIAKRKRLFLRNSSGITEVHEFFAFISDLIYERKTERRNNEKGC